VNEDDDDDDEMKRRLASDICIIKGEERISSRKITPIRRQKRPPHFQLESHLSVKGREAASLGDPRWLTGRPTVGPNSARTQKERQREPLAQILNGHKGLSCQGEDVLVAVVVRAFPQYRSFPNFHGGEEEESERAICIQQEEERLFFRVWQMSRCFLKGVSLSLFARRYRG